MELLRTEIGQITKLTFVALVLLGVGSLGFHGVPCSCLKPQKSGYRTAQRQSSIDLPVLSHNLRLMSISSPLSFSTFNTLDKAIKSFSRSEHST